MTRAAGLAALASLLALTSPAHAHHVGAWTPRDNEISANFKQVKFAVQARKFDTALRLYERGAVRQELRRLGGALPATLDPTIAGALRAGEGAEVERGMVLVLAVLIRDLAREADRQVGDAAVPRARRVAAGDKFLEAIWRYYNLIDFAVTQRDPKAATGMRLAFDEAEGYAKPSQPPPDPDKMLEPLRRIAPILTGVIEEFATPTRRQS